MPRASAVSGRRPEGALLNLFKCQIIQCAVVYTLVYSVSHEDVWGEGRGRDWVTGTFSSYPQRLHMTPRGLQKPFHNPTGGQQTDTNAQIHVYMFYKFVFTVTYL